MKMTDREDFLPPATWRQPEGQWARRGACAGAVGLGLGSLDAAWPNADWCDEDQHTLWHYWACSPTPLLTWGRLCEKADVKQRDQLSTTGAHAWHWLALHGASQSMQQWKHAWPVPPLGNWRGDTLVHCAAWSGDLPTLKLALHEEASFDALDAAGIPPLIISIYRGTPELAIALIAAGADPDVRDAQGRSALHHAALMGDAALLGTLDDAGGNSDLPDREGDTPASILDDRLEISDVQVAALRLHWTRKYQRKLWL
jgi:hypothetical protein